MFKWSWLALLGIVVAGCTFSQQSGGNGNGAFPLEVVSYEEKPLPSVPFSRSIQPAPAMPLLVPKPMPTAPLRPLTPKVLPQKVEPFNEVSGKSRIITGEPIKAEILPPLPPPFPDDERPQSKERLLS